MVLNSSIKMCNIYLIDNNIVFKKNRNHKSKLLEVIEVCVVIVKILIQIQYNNNY